MGNDGAMIIDENGRTVLADVTFKVDDSWTMVIASGEGIIYVDYDMNNEIGNNFFAVVQEVEKEMEDDVLKYVRDSILREYEDEEGVEIVKEGMIDIPFGKAYSIIAKATEEGTAIYVKQVVIIYKNKIYGFQMMSLDGNFADTEQKFDAIVESISK